MLTEEIDDAYDSIKNEKLWVLGAPDESTTEMHLSNIENLVEYIDTLAGLHSAKQTQSNCVARLVSRCGNRPGLF
jgi:hypothetical protein